jgi:uncharacterized protein YcbX
MNKHQSAKHIEMGFEYDRRWMLIDGRKSVYNITGTPCFSQFYPKIIDDKIEYKILE